MPVKKTKGVPALGQVQLTKNFYLNEFLESEWASRNDVDNTPNGPTVFQNIHATAEMLEEVRKACGNKGIFISSGYRSPRVNAGVGGSSVSDHMTGSAADIRAPGYGSPAHVMAAVLDASIKFGQMILEGTWVHISLPCGENDGQCLRAVFAQGQKTRYVPMARSELP